MLYGVKRNGRNLETRPVDHVMMKLGRLGPVRLQKTEI